VRRAIAVLILVAVSVPFYAASQTGSAAAEPASSFSIRFFDKKVYFLGDEILVEALITNTTAETLRFKVADNRVFNLDIDARTTTNLSVGHAREFTTERNSDQPVFFRELALEPGEKYGIVVDVTRYAAIKEPGLYILQASFFPELWRGRDSQPILSNKLTLSVKPPVATVEERAVVEAETGMLLAREVLPPDAVVAATLQARQKSQWERFFLYLDLESLLRKSSEKDRAWRRSGPEAQRQMLEGFRRQLMTARIDQEINVIPSSFEVQKTSYTPSEATVQVLEKFTYADYTELKRYTYHLKKQDRYWIIADYEIKNLGTE
jgi:hypothetical protein